MGMKPERIAELRRLSEHGWSKMDVEKGIPAMRELLDEVERLQVLLKEIRIALNPWPKAIDEAIAEAEETP